MNVKNIVAQPERYEEKVEKRSQFIMANTLKYKTFIDNYQTNLMAQPVPKETLMR